MSPPLGQVIRAGLVVPLLIVGALAGGLGFAAGRAVYPHTPVARISTVTTNAALPSPTPTTPLSTPPPAQQQPSSGGGSGSSDNCPAGCECRHPTGGIVIVCHGGSAVRIP